MAINWDEFEPVDAPKANALPTGGAVDWSQFEPVREPQSRNAFAVANDTIIEAANAAAGGIGAAADFFVPGNRFSKAVDEFVKSGEEKQSDITRADKEQFRADLDAADTIGEDLAAVGRHIARSPLQVAAQAAGSFAGPGLAVGGARGAAGLLGLGARRATAAGTAAGVATGAAMGGGDAAGSAYDLVQQIPDATLFANPEAAALLDGGMSPPQVREELATRAARNASVLPAIAGGVAGLFGAERILATGGIKQAGVRGLLATGAAEGATEAVEEGLTQFEGQRAAQAYDPSIDPTKNVAAMAALGGITGFGLGSGVHALSRPVPTVEDIGRANTVDEAIAAASAVVDQTGPSLDELEAAAGMGSVPPAEQPPATPALEPEIPVLRSQVVPRERDFVTPPAGSFGAMDELAGLVSQEQADVARRRAGLAESAFDEQIAAVDAAVESARQQASRENRRAVLDSVLDGEAALSMAPAQMAQAYSEALAAQGFANTIPTAQETARIERAAMARDAMLEAERPAVEPSLPNEMADPVPERKPIQPQTGLARVKQLIGSGYALRGKQMVNPAGDKVNLRRDELTYAKMLARNPSRANTAFDPDQVAAPVEPAQPAPAQVASTAPTPTPPVEPAASSRQARQQEAVAKLESTSSKELRRLAASDKRLYIRNAAADILQTRDAATRQKRSDIAKRVYARSKQIDPDRDSMAQAIAKLGGISRESATGRMRFAPEELKTRAGMMPVFTKGGRTMDAMGSALAELGYIQTDENGKHDQSDFEDKLAEVAGGADVFTPNGMMLRAQAELDAAMEEVGATDASDYTEVERHADVIEDLDADINFEWDEARALAQSTLTEEEIDGLFGIQPTRSSGLPEIPDAGNARESGEGTGAQEAGRREDAETAFALTAESADEGRARIAEAEQRQADERAAQEAADRKASADAEVDSFALTGSDRQADANPGQADIFDGSRDGDGDSGIRFSRGGASIDVDGIRRPTTNSNGQAIAGNDTAIRNFWRWFGDSKVVDAQGRPLVVYHGTDADFERFEQGITPAIGFTDRKGFYFTPNQEYAGDYGGKVLPVYLSIQNPYMAPRNGFEHTYVSDERRAELAKQGVDGVIFEGSENGTFEPEIVVFEPTQIKSIDNIGTFDPSNPAIRLSRRSKAPSIPQTETPAFKAWSHDAPLITSAVAGSHEFKSGEKVVVEAFHGTKRPDRVGTKFLKKRATSGPMSYFTSSPALASGYATGKNDTSLTDENQEYANWFKVKIPGQRTPVDIARAWHFLPADVKATIADRMPDIRQDDDGNVIYEEGGGDIGSYEWELQQTQRGSYDRRGNPLKAAVETWLSSGTLFGDESQFMTVLDLAGMPKGMVEFDSPHAEYPFVYKVFIAMRQPLVASDIPPHVMEALQEAAARDRSRPKYEQGADVWDKNTRTLREWVATLTDPANDLATFVWTSIPDKVTDVFRSLGYDGIIDESGKGGGDVHPVYIPFEETQVKSAIANSGKFDPSKNDIMKSRGRGAGMPVDAIQSAVDRLTGTWENAPRITVVQSVDELPFPAPGDVRGAYYRGQVWLVTDNLPNTAAMQFVLFHETLGHAGLRGAFGESLTSELTTLAMKNPHIRQAAAKWREQNADIRGDRTDARWHSISIEEALADMAGEGREIRGLDKFLAAMQKALRAIGLDAVANWMEGATNAEALAMLATARRFIEQGERAQVFGAQEAKAFSRDTPIPDALIGAPLGELTNHHDYAAAKSGDALAAIRVVRDVVTQELVEKIKIAIGNQRPIIQPVVAIEASGKNQIPSIAAAKLAEDLGLDLGESIVQSSSPKRTGLQGIDRIFSRPEFDGEVESGKSYLLVDDTITQGGTFAALTNHIERNGGKVVRVVALTGKQYSARIHLSDQTLGALREKYGDIEQQFQAATGYGFDALTESEARYLANFKPAESLRNRILEEGKSAGDEDGSPGLPQDQVDPPAFSRGAPQSIWNADTPSKMDDFLYAMQDKQIDTKRAVQAIKRSIQNLADQWDPYLQEELYHGRTAKQAQDFQNHELRTLMQDMQMRKVEIGEFEDFLHARHAKERNAQIAKVNPKMPDGGSGMTDQEADDYLANLDPAKRRAMEALARRVDAINQGTQQLLVSSGLEKQETINAWNAAYQHYVPLQREEVAQGGLGTGQGFSVRGSASKRAMGSSKGVIDILANVAMQRERAIVRAEKNRVALATYGLAVQAPNKDFWLAVNPGKVNTPAQQQAIASELTALGLDPADAANIMAEPKQRSIDPQTGLVVERVNPLLRSSSNVLAVRVDGEERYVFFSESDPRAQRMVTALKNLDADQLGRVLGLAAKASRWFAAVNTQYNPVFGVVNGVRDVQGALLNLSTTPIAGKQKEVMANTLSALRGIYIDTRDTRAGRPTRSTWAALYEEFQREGGQTGYRDMFATSADRTKALERELDPDNWMNSAFGKLFTAGGALKVPASVAAKQAKGVFGWLSDYNTAMENAVRLAAYKVGKDNGMSNQQAASLAKNLTVNFNRKGQVALQAGALYAFFNASVQGTARMAETLKGPAGKKIIAGGLLLGVMQALLLKAAGFDDEEPPEFVRERSLVIPTGAGKYVSIPMPLGFHVLPSISRITTEWTLSGFKDTPRRLADLVGLFADTFNPIGTAGLSIQTIAPTAVDPLVALSENRDWTGKPIAREDLNGMKPTPGHARANDTASAFSEAMSYWLNLASGGTKYQPGLFSPTPDQIDYLIGQVTGGVGREALKVDQTVRSIASGEDLPPHKIPLVGRFYGDTTGQSAVSSKFYSNLKRINGHKLEIEGRRKDRQPVTDYLRENPEALLSSAADATYREVADLRKMKRELIERDASKDRIKLIEQRATALMQRFNDRVASRQKEVAE